MEISLLPFKLQHLPLLHEILESQSYPDTQNIEYRTLPKIGYIAILGKQPISAGFLRRLEPCYAQIDTLCSNKNFGSLLRHEAINLVVNELLIDAKQLKLEGILAMTSDEGVIARGKSLGFHELNQTVLALSLK